MKLLIVTHSYAPDLNPRAFRWSAIATQLASRGHDVHVLCGSHGESVLQEEGVTVYRVAGWLGGASGVRAPESGVTARGATKGGSWRTAMRTAARALWRSLRWPDYACGWILPATRMGRQLCSRHGYHWIISVSHPFTGHVVGGLLRRSAPRTRWLVDIGDPFHLMPEPAPNNRRLFGCLNRKAEAHVVRASDSISVTTPGTKRVYEAFFAPAHGKVRVIPPLLSLPAAPVRTPQAAAGPIRLVYVGTLYRKLRSPRFLLECFAALRAALPARGLQLHFFGGVNDCAGELVAAQDAAPGTVFVHGTVGRAEVLQAMVDANLLVNIGNDSETQLASKVIEYMAVARPILNLPSSPSDTSLAALADYPSVFTAMASAGPLEPATLAALADFVTCPPEVPRDAVDRALAKYTLQSVADCYEAILNSEGSSDER